MSIKYVKNLPPPVPQPPPTFSLEGMSERESKFLRDAVVERRNTLNTEWNTAGVLRQAAIKEEADFLDRVRRVLTGQPAFERQREMGKK